MKQNLYLALADCDTDISGALRRLSGNEELYLYCLKAFLQDPTVKELNTSIHDKSWDEAFTAAHALKGMAGNMGFIPLFQASAELVVSIRDGQFPEINAACSKVDLCYEKLVIAIRQGIAPAQAAI